jgi:CheY-like chemotaxis protein
MEMQIPVENWTALIVDDTPDNVDIAQLALNFHGVTTYTASNGKEGLVALESLQPTFILLDISMPVMDGWVAIRHIRENPATASIPVIAMTAHVHPHDQQKVFDAGFDGYVAKPIRPDKFVRYIQECLSELTE